MPSVERAAVALPALPLQLTLRRLAVPSLAVLAALGAVAAVGEVVWALAVEVIRSR